MPTSFTTPISTSSPVIDTVMHRKRQLAVAQDKWKWGMINFVTGIGIFLEAQSSSFHFLAEENSPWRSFISQIESGLVLILFFNALYDWYSHIFPFGISSDALPDLPFSPMQLKLLGVKENEYGFKTTTPTSKSGKSDHPFGFPSPNGSFLSPQSNSNVFVTSLNSSSWIYQPGNEKSPTTGDSTKEAKVALSPSLNGTFTDEKSLKDYLRDYEQKEKTKSITNNLNKSVGSTGNNGSFWSSAATKDPRSSGNGRQDHSSILRNVAYQLSTPMPCSSDPLDSPGGNSGHLKSSRNDTKSESLCRKLGIDPLDLVFWMQNIRIWISQTILSRVVKEIDYVNKKLISCGLSDCLIGTVGVERLRKCAALPQLRDHLTELNNLLTFLSVSLHQDYLVERLKELAEGGALSEYKWNGGGKKWSDKLPTDAEIVMGCFAAYMDTCLPVNFRNSLGGTSAGQIVEDKPFSGVYFIVLPENSNLKKNSISSPTGSSGNGSGSAEATKQRHASSILPREQMRSIVILQSGERPAHFFLQVEGKDRLEISAGRNNLFHTLLFFLHHIKTKESGMLGRINLGASGVNVLWVIDG